MPFPSAVDAQTRTSFGIYGWRLPDEESPFVKVDLESAAPAEMLGTFELGGIPSRALLDGDNLYVLSYGFFGAGRATIVSLNINTGAGELVSDPQNGLGPSFGTTAGLAVDTVRDRLLVLDSALPSLLAVNKDTGSRTNISGGPVGSGPAWNAPRALRYDGTSDVAYVVQGDALVEVNLESGERKIISSSDVGSGPAPSSLWALSLDPPRRRALVRDEEQGFVFVALDSGERSVFATSDALSVVPLTTPQTAALTGQLEFEYDPARRTIMYYGVGAWQGGASLMEADELSGDWVVLLGRVP